MKNRLWVVGLMVLSILCPITSLGANENPVLPTDEYIIGPGDIHSVIIGVCQQHAFKHSVVGVDIKEREVVTSGIKGDAIGTGAAVDNWIRRRA